jgi:hypothetical protein
MAAQLPEAAKERVAVTARSTAAVSLPLAMFFTHYSAKFVACIERIVNRPSTIICHHTAMPDDLHLPTPRHNPEDINLGRIQADPDFLIKRVSKLPTRRELIRFRIWAALGLCVAALIGVHTWLRWVWACGLLWRCRALQASS